MIKSFQRANGIESKIRYERYERKGSLPICKETRVDVVGWEG
jgi:hypothetical protein